jgi:ABC-type transport system involved in Fe-S cluster assembly fused permease/ATPase subunit
LRKTITESELPQTYWDNNYYRTVGFKQANPHYNTERFVQCKAALYLVITICRLVYVYTQRIAIRSGAGNVIEGAGLRESLRQTRALLYLCSFPLGVFSGMYTKMKAFD